MIFSSLLIILTSDIFLIVKLYTSRYIKSTARIRVIQPLYLQRLLDPTIIIAGGGSIFKIGEFSKLTLVSVRMLRYYDEHNLLKPVKTDENSGYRLYDATQIKDLNKIIFLRDAGFNISEIKNVLAHWHEDFIYNALIEKKLKTATVIEAEKQRLSNIEKALLDLKTNNIETNYNILLKSVPSYKVISLRRTMPDYFHEHLLWEALFQYTYLSKIPIKTGAHTAIYHDLEYKEFNVDIEVCAVLSHGLSIDEKHIKTYQTKAIDQIAYTMVWGPFENIKDKYLSFAGWLQSSRYKMSGKSRQIVHIGPWNETDPEKFLTEIQIELENKNP